MLLVILLTGPSVDILINDLYTTTWLGLVSHSHLEQMRSTIEKSLNLVNSENTKIHRYLLTE